MRDIIFTKQNLNEYFLYSLFLLPLLGTSVPAYILAIGYLLFKITSFKFKIQDLFFLAIIVLWFSLKTQQSDLKACTVLFRYYFGFYVFYLFFNNIKTSLKLDKLLWLLCFVIILEAFLINTILPVQYLPNYPKDGLGDFLAETKILGFYQRPYSIGTSSTITSTLVMVLIFYVFGFSKDKNIDKSNKLLFLSIFTVIILGSGTGYALLLMFLVYKIGPFKNKISAIFSLSAIFLIYYIIFILDIGSLDGLDKISAFYLEFLYDFKATQIEEVISVLKSAPNQFYIGRIFEDAKDLVIWSDFAWLNLFECTGYIGLYVTIFIFIFKTNRYNYIPILVFLIGAIHYGAIYSLPGQLLAGYFMSTKFKNNEMLKSI
ncbi:hypothetical protein [Flavobacterium sp. N502540]|uniref:hypothetical protein n=1 Tax=Flavobacterium sp. N502540 TaxID=2986838 RepID=UPI0022259844|nr:hypothetical protein [Flavobacterium sp. N502540]